MFGVLPFVKMTQVIDRMNENEGITTMTHRTAVFGGVLSWRHATNIGSRGFAP